MSKRFQGILIGILIGTLLTSGIAFAKNGTEMIQAAYRNIKIYIDGVKIDPKDASGKTVEPFIYNGTTYLPVRAIGEAFGKQVSWDGNTNSVYVGTKPGDNVYLVDVCPPYYGENYTAYTSSKGEFLSMGGKKYTNGLWLKWANGYSLIRLDGKYNYMTCYIGRPDVENAIDATVNFFVDDNLVKTITIKGDALPKEYTIPLNKGLHLKIATDDDAALMDIVLK